MWISSKHWFIRTKRNRYLRTISRGNVSSPSVKEGERLLKHWTEKVENSILLMSEKRLILSPQLPMIEMHHQGQGMKKLWWIHAFEKVKVTPFKVASPKIRLTEKVRKWLEWLILDDSFMTDDFSILFLLLNLTVCLKLSLMFWRRIKTSKSSHIASLPFLFFLRFFMVEKLMGWKI